MRNSKRAGDPDYHELDPFVDISQFAYLIILIFKIVGLTILILENLPFGKLVSHIVLC